jgi:flagellar biosynthesis/type III secretory pathway chaperone
MSSHDSRTNLEAVLSNGIESMRNLKSLLLEERIALEQLDPDRLAATASSKRDLVAKLAGFIELDTAIAHVPEVPGPLADHWQKLRQVARECNELNRVNGTIIRSRHQQVLDGLAVLCGKEKLDSTYTASGSASAPNNRRTLTEA